MSYQEHFDYGVGNTSRDVNPSADPALLAKQTADILRGSEMTLISTIDHNAATKPKPFHHNFDLMTTLLRMEEQNV